MRKALNSSKLREANVNVYNEFFAAHPLIISGAGGFILAGSNTHFIDKPAIHYRVPLRNYLGVKFTSKKEVRVNSVINYDIVNNQFVEQERENYYLKIAEYLKYHLEKTKHNIGLAISCLNEIPRRHGLNNPGVHAANITTFFLLLTDKIKI